MSVRLREDGDTLDFGPDKKADLIILLVCRSLTGVRALRIIRVCVVCSSESLNTGKRRQIEVA